MLRRLREQQVKQGGSSIIHTVNSLASPPSVGTRTLGVIVSQAGWQLGHCWRLANLQYVPPSTEGGGYGEGWGGWRQKRNISRGVESGKSMCLTSSKRRGWTQGTRAVELIGNSRASVPVDALRSCIFPLRMLKALNADIYDEKMHRNLTFDTRLGLESSETRIQFVNSAVHSKIKSKIESVIESIIQSRDQLLVPTHQQTTNFNNDILTCHYNTCTCI